MDAAILCSFGKFTLEERQLAVNFIERIRDLKETKYQDDKGGLKKPYEDYLSNANNYSNMLDVIFQNVEEYLDEYNEEEDEEEDKLSPGVLSRQPTIPVTPGTESRPATQQTTPKTEFASNKKFQNVRRLQKNLKNWEERGQKDTPGYKRTEALMIKERNKLVKNTPSKDGRKKRLMRAFTDTVGGRKKHTKRKNRRKKKKRTKRKKRK